MRAGDASLHPLLNPARLLRSTTFDRSINQQHIKLYQPRYDDAPSLFPFNCGISVSLDTSKMLFHNFTASQDSMHSYFDPAIHTFDYVSQRSALLLTCIMWRAASAQGASSDSLEHTKLADDLFDHINRVLLPSLSLQRYCSVEIVQALLLLSAYDPPSGELSEDHSWDLVGWAIRMATNLNINSTITSTALLPVVDEMQYRQRRNAER